MHKPMITHKQRDEMLFNVARIEAFIVKDRCALRGLKRGSAEHKHLREKITALTRQTKEYRRQVAYLASGRATEEDEKLFIEMTCNWTRENQQRHHSNMARLCKERLGVEMLVLLPDGRKAPAWEFWLSQLISSDPSASYLTDEIGRIRAIYEKHTPHIPEYERLQRAFKAALRTVDLHVEGDCFDADDMAILMISNGLEEGEFEVVGDRNEPIVRLGAEEIRRLGTPAGMTTSVN